jgi:hypothetical protein
MKAFRTHLEVLPEEQRCLWPTLALALALPWLASARVLQDQPETLTLLTSASSFDGVKVSFFGGMAIGRVADPEITGDGVARVPSADVCGTDLSGGVDH